MLTIRTRDDIHSDENNDTRNEKPPVDDLIRCRFGASECMLCPKQTPWRSKKFDIHVCSKRCYDDAKEILNRPAPEEYADELI